jgi:hypothetical protein
LSNPEVVAAIVQEAAAKIVDGRRGINKEEATTDDGHPAFYSSQTYNQIYTKHSHKILHDAYFFYFTTNTNKRKRRPSNIHYL